MATLTAHFDFTDGTLQDVLCESRDFNNIAYKSKFPAGKFKKVSISKEDADVLKSQKWHEFKSIHGVCFHVFFFNTLVELVVV